MDVRVFCPCSERLPLDLSAESLELSSYPTTIDDSHTLHIAPYLNFCDKCQAVKCRRCTELEVVTKFCPRCLYEMKAEHSFCSRNCLDCPFCASNLVITQRKSTGTSTMKCSSCAYTYETEPIEKMRSVSRSVKKELAKNPDVMMFADLQRFYIQEKQLNARQIDVPKNYVTQFAELKVKDCDIYQFIRRSTIRPMAAEDIAHQYEQTDNSGVIPYDIGLRGHTLSKDHALPLRTPLICKHSKRCKACRSSLVKPDQDPSSVKFYKLSNAIDFIPALRIHDNPTYVNAMSSGSLNKFILVMANPLDTEISVSLSTYAQTPGQFQHTIHIPVSSFSLGPRPENALKLESIIQSTPSIELTKATKLSRVELMNRRPVLYDSDEAIYERGKNYIVVPLSVKVDDNGVGSVKVPLLVSFSGEGIGVAFWCVFEVKIC